MTHASTQRLHPMRGLGSFFAATLAKSTDPRHYGVWHARTWTATSLYVLPRPANRRSLKRLG